MAARCAVFNSGAEEMWLQICVQLPSLSVPCGFCPLQSRGHPYSVFGVTIGGNSWHIPAEDGWLVDGALRAKDPFLGSHWKLVATEVGVAALVGGRFKLRYMAHWDTRHTGTYIILGHTTHWQHVAKRTGKNLWFVKKCSIIFQKRNLWDRYRQQWGNREHSVEC